MYVRVFSSLVFESELPFTTFFNVFYFCRRLRDKIIDSERFSLAIDVTGKCGLDPTAVWFAWGLSQLKSGDFKDARENFSKCLTVRAFSLKADLVFKIFVSKLICI